MVLAVFARLGGVHDIAVDCLLIGAFFDFFKTQKTENFEIIKNQSFCIVGRLSHFSRVRFVTTDLFSTIIMVRVSVLFSKMIKRSIGQYRGIESKTHILLKIQRSNRALSVMSRKQQKISFEALARS